MKKSTNFMNYLKSVTFLLGVVLVSVTPSAWGQTAPALRAVVSADGAPEAMSQLFAKLNLGERTISVPGAAWLQLKFSEVHLGPNGVLTIIDASGQSQKFSQAQINAWGGLSAVFNGSRLRVTLAQGQGETEPVSASVKEIVIGLPASAVRGTEVVTPQPLRNLLGPNIRRFIPDDLRGLGKEGVVPSEGAATESICGTADDRVASNNPRVGRIMPIGCTGWLIGGGNLLTAGHCINGTAQMVQFNVPASLADGTPVAPPVSDQYPVILGSIVTQNTGVGNDWAVFRVLPSTVSGLLPNVAQGGSLQVSNTANPAQIRITGYGLDGPAPNFGAGGPLNAQSQTQQTHVGALAGNTGGPTLGVLSYSADTQGGNSGGPVIVEGTNFTIGIHTNAGCFAAGGNNQGTSFRNAALWTAINTATSGVNDGDPHIITVNGIHYDFQNAGEFVALRDANGLEIQTRQTPVATAPWVSLNTAVAARVGKHRVTWQPNLSGVPDPSGLQLRVDGVLTTLGPNGLALASGGRIVKTGADGIEINFPDGTALFVTSNWWAAQSQWYLNVRVFQTSAKEGIMGIVAPGSWLTEKFTDMWRVTDKTSLFEYAPNTSTATFTLPIFPAEKIPPMKPENVALAERVCRVVADKHIQKDCIFDVATTGDTVFAKTALVSQKIQRGATSTTVYYDTDSTTVVEKVTFTAAVKRHAQGRDIPTGSVQFTLDGKKAGKPVRLDKNGQAKWTATRLHGCEHRVAAHYTPSKESVFLASSSFDQSHAVMSRQCGKGEKRQ